MTLDFVSQTRNVQPYHLPSNSITNNIVTSFKAVDIKVLTVVVQNTYILNNDDFIQLACSYSSLILTRTEQNPSHKKN